MTILETVSKVSGCSDQLCLPVYVFLLLSSYANEHTGKVSKALLQLTKILVQYIMMQSQWILISHADIRCYFFLLNLCEYDLLLLI